MKADIRNSGLDINTTFKVLIRFPDGDIQLAVGCMNLEFKKRVQDRHVNLGAKSRYTLRLYVLLLRVFQQGEGPRTEHWRIPTLRKKVLARADFWI